MRPAAKHLNLGNPSLTNSPKHHRRERLRNIPIGRKNAFHSLVVGEGLQPSRSLAPLSRRYAAVAVR